MDKDNVLHCDGRIQNAPLNESTKFPYLLPTRHKLTTLIVMDANESHKHGGVNSTVTYVRQTYCIPRIRRCVQNIILKCVACRKVIGKPYTRPDPPPLSSDRLQEGVLFQVTRVNFVGPL